MTEEKKQPLIQIDDEVREMTPEEIENYEALSAHAVSLDNPE
jgi:hypothetical protein